MSKTWTVEEVKFLHENYNRIDINELSQILKRSTRSIEGKASKLGIRKTKKWTVDSIEYLHENYDLMSNVELAERLDTTVGSIERKASIYGLKKSQETITNIKKKWSDEQHGYLRDNYKRISPKEICKHLGITMNTLYSMTRYYGLQEDSNSDSFHKKSHNEWSEEETLFLLDNYMDTSKEELSNALNRSINSIIYKCSSLSIKKYERKNNWTLEEDNYLKEHYKSGLMSDMQEKIDRSYKSILTRANFLGLKRDTSTYIEREVEDILKSLKVDYTPEYNIRGFYADFLVDKTKVIEVHGDYWHCNPDIYPEPKNEIQEMKIKQDRMKRGCFNELGYTILYIWENDINNDYDGIVQQIKRFCRPSVKVDGL